MQATCSGARSSLYHAGLFCHRRRARGLVTINMHDPGLPPRPCHCALWSARLSTRQSTGQTTLPNPRPPPGKIVIAAHCGSHLLKNERYTLQENATLCPHTTPMLCSRLKEIVHRREGERGSWADGWRTRKGRAELGRTSVHTSAMACSVLPSPGASPRMHPTPREVRSNIQATPCH